MEKTEGDRIIDKIRRIADQRIRIRDRKIFAETHILVIVRERAEIGGAARAGPARRIARAIHGKIVTRRQARLAGMDVARAIAVNLIKGAYNGDGTPEAR